MTLLVVSLFVPYTISFSDLDPSKSEEDQLLHLVDKPQEQINSVSATTSSTVASTNGITKPSSKAPQALPPLLKQTPGATTRTEDIFIASTTRPNSLTLAKSNPTNSLRLPRLEALPPAWGKTTDLRQPPSQIPFPLPSSLYKYDSTLAHNATMVAAAASQKLQSACENISEGTKSPFLHHDYTIEPSTRGNGALITAITTASDNGLLPDKTWVGTLGMPTDALAEGVKNDIANTLEHGYESLIVYIGDGDMNGHYEQYCKTLLWPILHCCSLRTGTNKTYQHESWKSYIAVNQAFADRIVKHHKKGDTIWVHDYHFLLLPGLIRQQLPNAEIGLYIHSAFPSSEMFRMLGVHSDILEAMLGANLIAFQTEEYRDQFLETCSRLINVEATKTGILLEDGSFVHVNCFPMGIDITSINRRCEIPEVKMWVDDISKRYDGKKIIVARDKFDRNRGIKQKLLMFKTLLEQYPEYRQTAVFFQITNTSTGDVKLINEVSNIVADINRAYSDSMHQSVVFLQQDIDYSQYLALLAVADCLLIMSMREGMNLNGHEFVLCQDDLYPEKKYSPLVLSERVGAATVFGNDAVLINPWHPQNCAQVVKEALEMSAEEKENRWHNMYRKIMRNSATQWYQTYTDALRLAFQDYTHRDSASVPRLLYPVLKDKYEDAHRRLMFIDCEGTFMEWDMTKDFSLLNLKRAIVTLNTLVEDKNNLVYLMSQRGPKELDNMFHRVPGLGLVAENGAFLKPAGTKEWIQLANTEEISAWKPGAKKILEYYQERVEGSKIEELKTLLLFKYDRAADKTGASNQIAECAHQISTTCYHQDVAALHVDQGLCISDSRIHKSTATFLIGNKILEEAKDQSIPLPDFLLVIGDSREVDYVFDWAIEMQTMGIKEVVTVSVGHRNTKASYTLTQGTTGILSIFEKLAAIPPVHQSRLACEGD